jgi:hypothetical protein
VRLRAAIPPEFYRGELLCSVGFSEPACCESLEARAGGAKSGVKSNGGGARRMKMPLSSSNERVRPDPAATAGGSPLQTSLSLGGGSSRRPFAAKADPSGSSAGQQRTSLRDPRASDLADCEILVGTAIGFAMLYHGRLLPYKELAQRQKETAELFYNVTR